MKTGSPGGTIERVPHGRSSIVPPGLGKFPRYPSPSDKSPGYCHVPLRGKDVGNNETRLGSETGANP